MNRIFIPIGSGCASATLLKQKNLRTQSLPFDWILCHLKFVNDTIKSLHNDSIERSVDMFLDKNNLVYSTFVKHGDNTERYVDDVGNVHEQKFEYYKTLINGTQSGHSTHPYNRVYKVTFPHDDINIDVAKYTNRLERLKGLLLDKDNFISFLYISPSSNETHYCINDEVLTNNASIRLNELCDFLETKRTNFEIIYVDALNEDIKLNDKIRKIPVIPYKNWSPMITKNVINL